jgi:hypothetical protein
VESILQVVGAVLVLTAFVAAQLRLLHQEHPAYLVLNALGAAILAVLALREQQWGFLLLEGAWTLVSLRGVIQWWNHGPTRRVQRPTDTARHGSVQQATRR